MKILSVLCLMVLLTACGAETRDRSSDFKLNDDLKGCKVFTLDSDSAIRLYVVKCPNSIVSTTQVHDGESVTVTIQ